HCATTSQPATVTVPSTFTKSRRFRLAMVLSIRERSFVTGPAVLELGSPKLGLRAVVLVDLRMGRVAVQAPTHLERVDPTVDGHDVLDLAVALLAAHAALHVALVREVDEVGKVVDLHPGDGLVVGV